MQHSEGEDRGGKTHL